MFDRKARFSPLTVLLHWGIAAGILAAICLYFYADFFLKPRTPERSAIMGIHKTIGYWVIWAASFRLIWRGVNGYPKSLGSQHPALTGISHLVHTMLLLLAIITPLMGEWASNAFGNGDRANGQFYMSLHWYCAYTLIFCIALHVAGTIKHQLIDKDQILCRSLGAKVKVD
ncbi:hypothetical protein E1162_16250 [Rhodobacteraceae bacterium RKSG542]|uniref:cytochrome b n=1 Tax=Pseudovibrio flavus TaxID=2529854 RepID=UPI0012BBED70|nr:cytochrome b/b6 domain-containing protein [Pseudovibrio flavus]MTI18799.1 hypothetical protein [Pseudovibrio flavus]